MAWTLMSGFVSNEQDKEFVEKFPEGVTAEEFINKYLDDKNSIFFWSDEDHLWLNLTKKNNKLHVEIGEPAA